MNWQRSRLYFQYLAIGYFIIFYKMFALNRSLLFGNDGLSIQLKEK